MARLAAPRLQPFPARLLVAGTAQRRLVCRPDYDGGPLAPRRCGSVAREANRVTSVTALVSGAVSVSGTALVSVVPGVSVVAQASGTIDLQGIGG